MLNAKQAGNIGRFEKWKNMKENGLNKFKLLSDHNKCEWIRAILVKNEDF